MPFMGSLEVEGRIEPGLIERVPFRIPAPLLKVVVEIFVVVYRRTPDYLAYLKGQISKGTKTSAQSVIKPTGFGEPLYIIVSEKSCRKMRQHRLERNTYDPALLGLLDGFCFEFGERYRKVAALTFRMVQRAPSWAVARERVLERIFGIVEWKRNLIPSFQGGISFKFGQPQDHSTLRSCHDWGKVERSRSWT